MITIKNVHPSTRSAGFNLLELMVVVAILGITALIAVPNMSRMVENSQLRSTVNNFSTALSLARSEALTSGNGFVRPVSADFANGWCVARVDACDDLANPPIREFPALIGQAVDGSNASIQFNSRGELVGNIILNFTFQATACISATARIVTVELSGRTSVTAGACL